MSLFMMLTAPFANLNIFSNATAQGYNENYSEDKKYSKYPTDDKKYECRTGPFEGFFVSSVEFCKHVKFDDWKANKEWFVCNNDDIDCTIQIPEQQISFEGPNSGNYTQCDF